MCQSYQAWQTEIGVIRVKVIRGPGGEVQFSPEYDDCKRVAKKSGVALRDVVRRVSDQARREAEG